MFCTKCGKELDDGAEYCSYCGYNIKNVEAAKSSSSGRSKLITPERAAALNSNKILLIFAGAVLGVVLITIMIVVITMANSSKGGSVIDTINAGEAKSNAYFDRPLSVNQTVEFGRYEQDGNTANGKEPIKWRVVSVDNDRYLLYAQNVLDCVAWDDGSGSAGGGLAHGSEPKYDNSSMRSFMNDTFDAEAFNEEELGYIIPVSFRNGIITVDKGNQYAKDHSFIPSSDELFYNLPTSMGTWGTLAPPTQYAKSKGVPTEPIESYTQVGGVMGDSVTITEENKRYQSYSLFRADNTDFFDVGGVALYHVRDTKEFNRRISPCFVDVNGKVSPENVTDRYGIRPAIYLSKDACYTAPVQVNEKLGSAADKMSEYKGTYIDARHPDDKPDMFSTTLTVKQGYFEMYISDFRSNEEEFRFIDYTLGWAKYSGKYNLSDFTYEKDGGKDVFTDYNKGVRLVYDPGKREWTLYLKFVKGDFQIPDDKTDKWLSCINFVLSK